MHELFLINVSMKLFRVQNLVNVYVHYVCVQWSAMVNTPGPVENESCYKPCPVDCVVSEWSSWSTCSQTCGLGNASAMLHRLFIIIMW